MADKSVWNRFGHCREVTVVRRTEVQDALSLQLTISPGRLHGSNRVKTYGTSFPEQRWEQLLREIEHWSVATMAPEG